MAQGRKDRDSLNNTDARLHLCNDFSKPSAAQWRAMVDKQLKGASFDDIMVTATIEGISLDPIYNAQDASDLPTGDIDTPLRAKRNNTWGIAQSCPYPTCEEFNQAALNGLNAGQTVIDIPLDLATRLGLDPDQARVGDVGADGVSICSIADLSRALNDIEPTPFFVCTGSSALPFASLLAAWARSDGQSPSKLSGCVGADPLGELASRGKLPISLQKAYSEMAETVRWASQVAPNLRTILVTSSPYHDAGASAVEELAYAIATGVTYLAEMEARGLAIDTVSPAMQFSFSIGSNFFVEIAKLRAARRLWARVIDSWGGSEQSRIMAVYARTSAFGKTNLEPFVNLLRSTTEAFSGVVGGCDMLQVSPFDEAVRIPDEFSSRIARNTQLVLQQESHLDEVSDPANGSWYVEWLTNEIAVRAWKLFQDVEKSGGMFRALEQDLPQEQILRTARVREGRLISRRDILVGVNRYVDLEEERLADYLVDYHTLFEDRSSELTTLKTNSEHSEASSAVQTLLSGPKFEEAVAAAKSGATLGEIRSVLSSRDTDPPAVTPLAIHSRSDKFSRLRKAVSVHKRFSGSQPEAFLAVVGPPQKVRRRVEMVTEFFRTVGYGVKVGRGLVSPEQAVEAAVKSRAGVIVICSTDEAYPGLVPRLTEMLKGAIPGVVITLAGHPAVDIERYMQAGVEFIVHESADVWEVVSNCIRRQGGTV